MLAETTREPAEEAVEITYDATIPRLYVTLREAATGPGFAEALSALYRSRPELTYADKLYDLTRYRSTVTHADVMVIVEAYRCGNTDSRHPCRTAFVSVDPNFGLWARSMGHLFPGREHRAFLTRTAAVAFLDEPLSGRAPFLPD